MGFAAPNEEEFADTISIGDYLLRDKNASYLLEVEGNAMKDEGILNGDIVIFERTSDYSVGDIVVALNEDGYSLKRLRKSEIPNEYQVIGVVTSTFRRYKK